jgi:hypothetical protein
MQIMQTIERFFLIKVYRRESKTRNAKVIESIRKCIIISQNLRRYLFYGVWMKAFNAAICEKVRPLGGSEKIFDFI